MSIIRIFTAHQTNGKIVSLYESEGLNEFRYCGHSSNDRGIPKLSKQRMADDRRDDFIMYRELWGRLWMLEFWFLVACEEQREIINHISQFTLLSAL